MKGNWRSRANISLPNIESTGLARLREALEAHEWDAPTNDAAYDLDKSLEELELTDYDNGDVSGFGEGQPDLGLDVADLDDSSQLRLPILAPSAHDIKDERGVDMEEEDEEHDEVREMEHMMTKLLAVKGWWTLFYPVLFWSKLFSLKLQIHPSLHTIPPLLCLETSHAVTVSK